MSKTGELDDIAFEVEFMSCVVDKADNLRVLESDSHFSDFTGVHPSKIKQGKLHFHDILIPADREMVMKQLCKKNSPYVYIDFYIKKADGSFIYVHCIAQNIEGSTKSRLAIADVSRSQEKSKMLKRRADSMNRLIDLVEGGVCLFKVTSDMQFIALYMNKACRRFFGTANDTYRNRTYRLDDLIYYEDKSAVFQAVGNTMATKKPIDMELRVITHGDGYLWCKLNSAIQRYDEDGCPIFHAVLTDISKVKEAEQSADSKKSVITDVFKHLPGPLFYTNLHTPFRLETVTDDFMALIGYSRSELFEELGGDLSKLICSDTESISDTIISLGLSESVFAVRYSIKTKSGKILQVIDRRKVVESENGIQTTIGIIKDETAVQVGDNEI